jgi:hypothetical protein
MVRAANIYLERDVRMPTSRSKAANIRKLVCQATTLLLLLAADDGYLVAEL